MADILTFPLKPADHLRAALRRLDAALSEQKSAIAEFRGSIAGLQDAVAGLSAGMDAYQGVLAETARHVATGHVAARQLDISADRLQASVP